VFLNGSAEASLARIEAYREAGVITPVLMPVSVAGTPEERAERVAATLEDLAATRRRAEAGARPVGST
jgi:hypothetical protein